ncbi:MAG: 4-hydroxythreonine-4-phosphate dehydrogenase PdxA [Desulfovibrio sp.]|uniref:4-hydroxythreonine-4-phosphate dehydrogenase PdxA n=1 Tax=Desulfovibrio sp. 7SRBS1 TaxID=3378064 RepID=UPI003B3F3965
MKQPLLITLGDPNGLGPELVCMLARSGVLKTVADRPVILVGPREPLAHWCDVQNIEPFWTPLTCSDVDGELPEQGISLLVPAGLNDLEFTPGQATKVGGLAAGASLETAVGIILSRKSGALVTCPLNKAMLNKAGFAFPGHTEFLAQRSGLAQDAICMYFHAPKLSVGLVTTHPPLRDVAGLISQERVMLCARLIREFLARTGKGDKPLAVCGLNPHAGEEGLIGDEEVRVIGPAVAKLREEGLAVEGPFPADTVFGRVVRGEFGAVLAMYHDQGLGPLKLLHFGEAVNVTLGLPFVRTSPDHGTGYDLVGTGKADTGGLRAALELAVASLSGC